MMLTQAYPALLDFIQARNLIVIDLGDTDIMTRHIRSHHSVYIMTGSYKDALSYLSHQRDEFSTQSKLSDDVNVILIITKPYKGHQFDTRIESIDAWRLMFNPTQHKWVPQYEPISEDELPLHVDKHMLPVLHPKDPIVIWFGFKVGTIIRIVRVCYEYDNVMYRRVQ